MLILQAEITQIEDTYVKIDELKDMKLEFKSGKTGTVTYLLDSGPIGPPHVTELSADANITATGISADRDQSDNEMIPNVAAYRTLFHAKADSGLKSSGIPFAPVNSTLWNNQSILLEKHTGDDK